jgi:hypothetical protein
VEVLLQTMMLLAVTTVEVLDQVQTVVVQTETVLEVELQILELVLEHGTKT